MAGRFLIQVDLERLLNPAREDIDLKTISFLDCVLITVNSTTFSASKGFLRSHFNAFSTYCDVTALGERHGDVISLLDNGASRVFVTEYQFKVIVKEKLLVDLSRLIIYLDYSYDSSEPATAAEELKNHIQTLDLSAEIGIAIRDKFSQDVIEECAEEVGRLPTCYANLANFTLDQHKKWLAHGYVSIVPAMELTIDPAKNPEKVPVWLLIASSIRTDRTDGLFPTVVTDEHRICLGLVYSNHESIEEAVKSGRGVYWSRSRNKLWIKGAESGDTQDLVTIGWDCDADALQFVVRQKGDGKGKITSMLFRPINHLTWCRLLPSKAPHLLRTLFRYCTP